MGRFINADDTEVLNVEQGSSIQYNLFTYCLNNPVNRTDDSGYLSIPNWLKVTIGVAAIGIGVAATAITGGAAIPVLLASIKIAATSAVIGAVVGAGTSAVGHRITTGSWQGADKAALDGAIDGAADGFMWGGISAGATFTTAAAKGIKIKEIGTLKPSNKSGNGYKGVKYTNKRGSLRSLELHSPHNNGPHNIWHWQRNVWNPRTNAITGGAKHWTFFWRQF